MDLSTTYMGFTLPHPLVPGASPMVDDLDTVRRLEDAGAPMLVMHSLFEEQIVREGVALTQAIEFGDNSQGEAMGYFPAPPDFVLGPDEYLEQLRRIKAAVGVPVRLAGLLDDGAQRQVGEGVTDADGRIRSLIDELVTGVYRLTFELHLWRSGFLREVTLEIEVDDASRSWHVPLLVAPYGATTYRGS